MTVSCNNCGEEWPRDPVLEVECPMCRADVGEKCKRPSEHSGGFVHPHSAREKRALREVDSYGHCTGTIDEPEIEEREFGDPQADGGEPTSPETTQATFAGEW